jgi:hypothetical protein
VNEKELLTEVDAYLGSEAPAASVVEPEAGVEVQARAGQ